MRKVQVALVEGDGSAPEMMAQATKIAVAAAKLDDIEIEFVSTPMGWSAYEKYGDTLPDESFKKASELKILFFGGVGDPKLDDTLGKEKPEMKPEGRCLLTIRNSWGLLINHRPAVFYPELRSIAKVRPEAIPETGVRQDWLRFLLQDSYFGTRDLLGLVPGEFRRVLGLKTKDQVDGGEYQITELSYYKRETLLQYFRFAFEYARKIGVSVIAVDKANVMPRYVFWSKLITNLHEREFPDVPMQNIYVDNTCQLLFNPAKLHGVIICGNEHGDILSDGAAESVGSLGLMCSSAINPDTGAAMFESGAGTAPTLAGQNKANPIGRILAAALMLRHIGAERGALAIENAVRIILSTGSRTYDLIVDSSKVSYYMHSGTAEMGELILNWIVNFCS